MTSNLTRPKVSETTFKKRVLKDLKTLPKTWFIKTQERGRVGTPDILMCMQGSFVAIELKRVGGIIAPIQELTLSKILGARGFAFVADPETWSAQFEILKEKASRG